MGSIGLALTAGPNALPLPPTFQDLYEQHASTVYRTALRVTGNAADAEDALQTVFLRLMNQPVLDLLSSSEHYLRRAATNAAIDILRKKQTQRETPLDLTPERTSPAKDALLKESLRRALAKLDPEDAQLFTLRNLEGFSYDELAGMFAIERGTVASRLHRIRQDLLVFLSR
ncbi:MAG: sigma-70 family RNA polymerase sigma factor [Acidobacteria bacterium]|nr:sigma-70 family RNA polymerase sigma factor [Acidobacteriota bacterium]